MREFWRRQETYWFRLAESEDLSARISTFLGARDARTFSPEAENGVEALVEIFDRVCVTLDLDLGNEAQPRTIARTLIKAAIDGESDPEKLFHVGLKAVSN